MKYNCDLMPCRLLQIWANLIAMDKIMRKEQEHEQANDAPRKLG